MKRKRIGRLIVLSILIVGLGVVVLDKPAHALSNLGPDPAEFVPQAASGRFAYGLSSEDHDFASIPSTRVFLYFPNNTGNKSVVIIGGDTCTDPQNSALTGAGGNYWDRPYGSPIPPGWALGNLASVFSVGTAVPVSGNFSASNTCYRDEKTLTFPGTNLTYDPNTGLYKVAFIAAMHWTTSNAQNHFQLRLTDPAGIIGYDAGLAENSVAVLRYNRDPAQVSNGYAEYLLPFAPDCTVTTPRTASGYWYDDDNDSPATQPVKFKMELRKTRISDGQTSLVDLRFFDASGTPPGPTVVKDPGVFRYTVTSGNKKSVRMDFTVEPGYRYVWRWNPVFHRNVLQFRLPFDSIYYLTGCRAPAATVTPHSEVDKNQVSPGETARFTHDMTVSAFQNNGSVNWQVHRTRNGVPVPLPTPTGQRPFTGNGDYPIQTNDFSPDPADVGARICEHLELSPLVGAVTFSGNPTTPVCVTVVNRPYFQVQNGDISAGAGMDIAGVGCNEAGGVAPNPRGGIASWNRGAANAYGGAGARYGAITLGFLKGFATGQGSATYAPSQLAFANTGGGPGQVDPGQEHYGGKFGSINCLPDFWENAHGVINGDTWIDGQTIANGTRQVMYVNGNVYIGGNITFQNNAYADLSQVPSFTVVARGNIYISRNVTQLDGFYIAQPNPNPEINGMIKTCTVQPDPMVKVLVPAALDRFIQSNCGNPLTLNGAVVAGRAWLNRASGSVFTTPAETFNYAPEFWVTAPYGNGLSTGTDDEYDSITSLPPVL